MQKLKTEGIAKGFDAKQKSKGHFESAVSVPPMVSVVCSL